MIKICDFCKKTFETPIKKKRFCSVFCQCKNWDNNHKERIKELKKRYKYKAKPINTLRRDLRKRYGISFEVYQNTLRGQNNLCAICGKNEMRKNRYGGICRLHIDHDHKTGEFRGLLCNKCNACLGLIDDRIDILQKMIDYLTKNPTQ